jgi:uncharacterized Zn finger protein (UPF0148 family)
MFCKNCGNPMNDGELFCAKCGYRNVSAVDSSDGSQSASGDSAQSPSVCPVCGSPVSPGAAFCKSCGATLNGNNTGYTNNGNYTNNFSNPQNYDSYSTPQKKKMRKAPFIIGGVAAVVVVIGGVCAVNASTLTNFFKKTFSSPENYYKYVEEKEIKNTAKSFSESYDSYLNLLENVSGGGSSEATVSARLEDGGRSMLSALTGTDFSWLSEISMKINAKTDSSSTETAAELYLNSAKLASLQVAADLDIQEMYMKVPELSEEYLGIDLNQLAEQSGTDLTYSAEMLDLFSNITKLYPDSDTLSDMLERYGKIVINDISDVKKSTESLTVGNVTQKCTVLETTISSQDMADICSDVLNELKSDKDVEKIIHDFITTAQPMYLYMDADTAYQEFLTSINDLQSKLDNELYSDSTNYMINKIWVDNSGMVVGRSLSISEYGEIQPIVTYARPQKGKEFGLMLSINGSGSTIEFSGSGKTSGSKQNGSYSLSVDSIPIFSIQTQDYDLKSAKEGYLKGSFTLKPETGIASLSGSSALSMFSAYSLKATFDSSKKGAHSELSLMSADVPLFTLSLESDPDAKSVEIFPSDSDTIYNMMNEDDLINYMTKANWQGLIDSLNNSDIPSEYLEMIVSRIQSLQSQLEYYSNY